MTAPYTGPDDEIAGLLADIRDATIQRLRARRMTARGPTLPNLPAAEATSTAMADRLPRPGYPVDMSMPERVGRTALRFLGDHADQIGDGLAGLDPTAGGVQGFLGSAAEGFNRVRGGQQQDAERRRALADRAQQNTRLDAREARDDERADAEASRADASILGSMDDILRARRGPVTPVPKAPTPSRYEEKMGEYEAMADALRKYPELRRKLLGKEGEDGDGPDGEGPSDKDLDQLIRNNNTQQDNLRGDIAGVQRGQPQPDDFGRWASPSDSTRSAEVDSTVKVRRGELDKLRATGDSLADVRLRRKQGRPDRAAAPAPAADPVQQTAPPGYGQDIQRATDAYHRARKIDPQRADAAYQRAVTAINRRYNVGGR